MGVVLFSAPDLGLFGWFVEVWWAKRLKCIVKDNEWSFGVYIGGSLSSEKTFCLATCRQPPAVVSWALKRRIIPV